MLLPTFPWIYSLLLLSRLSHGYLLTGRVQLLPKWYTLSVPMESILSQQPQQALKSTNQISFSCLKPFKDFPLHLAQSAKVSLWLQPHRRPLSPWLFPLLVPLPGMPSLHSDNFHPLSQPQLTYPLLRETLSCPMPPTHYFFLLFITVLLFELLFPPDSNEPY